MADRASADRAALDALLDEVLVAHVGLSLRRGAAGAADRLRPRRRPAAVPRLHRLALAAGAGRRRGGVRHGDGAGRASRWPARPSSRACATAAPACSARCSRAGRGGGGRARWRCSPTASCPDAAARSVRSTARELAATLVLALPITRVVAEVGRRLPRGPGRRPRRRRLGGRGAAAHRLRRRSRAPTCAPGSRSRVRPSLPSLRPDQDVPIGPDPAVHRSAETGNRPRFRAAGTVLGRSTG